MKEVTEVVYQCEVCEEVYGHKEDCVDCEVACNLFKNMSGISGALDDAIESLNKTDRTKLANAIINTVTGTLETKDILP